ncbi:B-cell differentiation antigen CD72 isoform X2 [Marmota marmota marmota]|uniref:B-cell differentiation antigen CD72 isoform X2 n=1 Tax=Marmota marmota marmota TaxID=9994 RepID=UPI00209342FC|nr:B-cell differentiation antigen CD72 isoform X2 [Marmota marmota marmota]
MADAITYADLRFVKAPLKKIVSSQLGEDPEAYEDGELTYENVQVPSVPGGPSGLASSGLGDKSGFKSEQLTATWSSVTSPPVGRLLPCSPACLRYLLFSLLLTCLLLGVAAICLGARYLQVSQKLQQVSSVLEDTNSSLQEQLHLRITQLGQKEENLQESKRKLAQSQEVLQVAQENRQTAEGKLKDCQLDKEKTQETLQREEDQRRALQERLHNMQDTLKPFFTCSQQDMEHMALQMLGYCCPVGWILKEYRCFYFSSIRQTWEESQNYCKSLSSNLATFRRHDYSFIGEPIFSHDGLYPYWISSTSNKDQWKTSGLHNYGCNKIQKGHYSQWYIQSETCTSSLPFICEQSSFRFPDGDHSLQ